ncbi:hypothetical protein [Bradyrhizobium iriomotense]|uniref:hypothetical protein n=1 Tax=Bradyrhizobium iriomotense TaxID=441950 RepID=UPI001B8A0FD7|nr:hypothetical protein [Bradyrhizobium iriomotense]MBR1130607.1 hypothetical protein [Bradyrhizobium iriomotense]
MALRMVALSRAADGRWFAREGIPADDVAAVRELYGTVLNEGANRGILVTTRQTIRAVFDEQLLLSR